MLIYFLPVSPQTTKQNSSSPIFFVCHSFIDAFIQQKCIVSYVLGSFVGTRGTAVKSRGVPALLCLWVCVCTCVPVPVKECVVFSDNKYILLFHTNSAVFWHHLGIWYFTSDTDSQSQTPQVKVSDASCRWGSQATPTYVQLTANSGVPRFDNLLKQFMKLRIVFCLWLLVYYKGYN